MVAKQAEKADAENENESVEEATVAEERHRIQDWSEKTKETREQYRHEMQRVRDRYWVAENAFSSWSARLREAARGL